MSDAAVDLLLPLTTPLSSASDVVSATTPPLAAAQVAIPSPMAVAPVPPPLNLTPGSSFSEVPSFPISSLSAYEGGYRHNARNMTIELSTILPESNVTTHGKTFVKTADLAYFSWLKKHSKVWDYGTQLLEVQSKKKYWSCNNCKLFLAVTVYFADFSKVMRRMQASSEIGIFFRPTPLLIG